MKVRYVIAALFFLLSAPAGGHSQHVLEFIIPPCPHVGIVESGGHDPGALLFPNPVTGCLTLRLAGQDGLLEDRVVLLDMQGKIIMEQTVGPSCREARIDLAGVVPGVYILRFSNGGRRHQQKIIVGNH
jgi:hypothetical protein